MAWPIASWLREGRLKLGILEPDPGAREHPLTVPRRLLEPGRIVEEFLEAMGKRK